MKTLLYLLSFSLLMGCGTAERKPDITNIALIAKGMPGIAQSEMERLIPTGSYDLDSNFVYDTLLISESTLIEAQLQFDQQLLTTAQVDLIPPDKVTTDSLMAQLTRYYTARCAQPVRDGDFLVWQGLSEYEGMAVELADQSGEYGAPHISLTVYSTFGH